METAMGWLFDKDKKKVCFHDRITYQFYTDKTSGKYYIAKKCESCQHIIAFSNQVNLVDQKLLEKIYEMLGEKK